MADIPTNLDLGQFLAPSYTNHPRHAVDGVYCPILKAFVIPRYADLARKARPGASKASKQSVSKKQKTAETSPAEVPVTHSHDEGDKHFLCEKAKSGISRCRKCGQSILKSTLRFGYPSPDPRGEYGAIPIWFHIRCAPISFLGFEKFDADLASKCFGFSSLTEEEREEAFNFAGKGTVNILNDEDAAEYAGEDFSEERLVQRRGVSVPLLNPPPEITGATLLPFQREGYSWMMAQEANPATRGGILADEMGMGKTLQTISLIVSKRDSVRPTLVVCPVAAVMQWYSEIEKFTSHSNLLSVHVYHGSQKISAEKLAEFDVVLTTYQTLENEYRKQANKAKVSCKYCHRMFLPGKLSFHLKYMCGPNAMRTAKQSMREIKSKSATEKAKSTMGIGSSSDLPPTISNVLKDIVKQSGLLSEDKIDGMSQYDLMRLYGGRSGQQEETPEVDEEGAEGVEDAEEKVEVKAELGMELDEGTKEQLKKTMMEQTVAELKQILIDSGTSNFSARIKKADLVDLILDSYQSRASSPSEAKPPTKRKPTTKSSRSSSSSSPPPTTAAPVGRRSAAVKALQTFKADDGESSSDDDDSEVDRPKSTKGKPLRKPKAAAVTKKRGRAVVSSSSDSSFASSSSDSSVSLSSSDASSESSGDTLSISSESEEVESPPPKGRGRAGQTKRATATGKRPIASQSVVRNRFNEDDENNGEYDEGEDAVEDIDLNLSPLHSVKWGRLVLDEAHRIKQRTNSTSLAAFALAADFRWCLSGTPLQNRVGELYSLVRFLRFSPFAHYFCKGCDCKSLHFRFVDNRHCVKCGCARTKHYSYFKQTISGPIVKYGIGDGSALAVLKTQVLDTILLRRTKIERQADLNLPSISVEVKKKKLTQEEHDFYESLYKQSMLKFDTFAKSGTLLHNYAHIFDLLTRLRQALDHPYLIVYGSDYTVPTTTAEETTGGKNGSAGTKQELRGICALCQDDIGDEPRAVANCGHKFHSDCVKEYIRDAPQLVGGGCGCPACFVPLTVKFEEDNEGEEVESSTAPSSPGETLIPKGVASSSRSTILDRIGASGFQTSTKIESVIEELQKLEPGSKVLIFSQFTRMLDLVEFRVKQCGVGCAKLTGALNLAQRSNIILAFNTDPSMRALLISLKAGGEGLNLQAADRVFLIDPWWNPASELQAIQRAHRIGQTRPVKAIRFVTENSVEEKVIALQEMKQLVFDATVGQSQGAERKLTESDLRFLFQH